MQENISLSKVKFASKFLFFFRRKLKITLEWVANIALHVIWLTAVPCNNASTFWRLKAKMATSTPKVSLFCFVLCFSILLFCRYHVFKEVNENSTCTLFWTWVFFALHPSKTRFFNFSLSSRSFWDCAPKIRTAFRTQSSGYILHVKTFTSSQSWMFLEEIFEYIWSREIFWF